MKKHLLIVVILIIIIGGAYYYYLNFEDEKLNLETENRVELSDSRESLKKLRSGQDIGTDFFDIVDVTRGENGGEIKVIGNEIYILPAEDETFSWVVLSVKIHQPFSQILLELIHEGGSESRNVVSFVFDGNRFAGWDERVHFPEEGEEGVIKSVILPTVAEGTHRLAFRVDRYGEYTDSGVKIKLLKMNYYHKGDGYKDPVLEKYLDDNL